MAILSSVRGDDGQSGHVKGVPVALDDLRGNRGHLQPQPLADALFVFRLQVGGVADRPGKLAHPHLLGRQVEALQVAAHLRIPVRQLQAEGNGLGVDAVGAADHRRVLEFEGAAAEHLDHALQAAADDGRSLLDQQRLRRIDHIIGGQAIVQPARLGTDLLGHRRGKGDDVMLDLGLDGLDARELEIALLADGASCRLRHQSGFGQSLGGGHLNLQPGAELVFIAPDAAHLRARISCESRHSSLHLNRDSDGSSH